MEIITPKDGTFAISDTIKSAITQARSWIAIAVPWVDIGFADYFREIKIRELNVLLLTRRPERNNKLDERTLETVDVLAEIVNEKSGHFEVRYSPRLHDKFIVVDGVLGVKDSLNYTTCGRYHNFESLEVIKETPTLKVLSEWFRWMWKHPTTKAGDHSKKKTNFDQMKASQTVISHLDKNGKETEGSLITLVRKTFCCNGVVAERLLKRLYREGIIYICNEQPRVYALTRPSDI